MELNLDQGFVNFDGSIIEGLTLKGVLLQYLGTFSSQKGEDMIAAYTLGQRVYEPARQSLTLSDKELELVKNAISKPQHIAMVYAQMYVMIHGGNEGDVERV